VRISFNTFRQQWLSALHQQQATLAKTQQQVNTGVRVSTGADNPAGAAQIMLLQHGLDRLDNFKAGSDTARRRLGLEENALNKVTDALNRVRELAVEAGGGTLPPESIRGIAVEVRQLLGSLVSTANSQDGEGRYLFSGNRVHSKPFDEIAGALIYNGDQGVRTQRIAENRTVQEADPGFRVFSSIRDGNGTFAVDSGAGNTGTAFYRSAALVDPAAFVPDTYTIGFTAPDSFSVTDAAGTIIASGAFSPGDTLSFKGVSVSLEGVPAVGDTFVVRPSRNQDLFTSVSDLAATLEAFSGSPVDRAKLTNGLNSGLVNMDRALANISDIRSQVGARLNIIDEQRNSNEETVLHLTQALASVRNVDYAGAVSTIQQQLFSLEAAQKTFTRTQASSLFSIL